MNVVIAVFLQVLKPPELYQATPKVIRKLTRNVSGADD
jgi:hypothetical protein